MLSTRSSLPLIAARIIALVTLYPCILSCTSINFYSSDLVSVGPSSLPCPCALLLPKLFFRLRLPLSIMSSSGNAKVKCSCCGLYVTAKTARAHRRGQAPNVLAAASGIFTPTAPQHPYRAPIHPQNTVLSAPSCFGEPLEPSLHDLDTHGVDLGA